MARKKLVIFAAVAALLGLSACSPIDDHDLKRLALPVAASDRTLPMWNVWLGAWIAVLVVFLLVFGLIVYASIRYRRRPGNEIPAQIRYNLPIEALYTIAPVIAVGVFFFHTVTNQNEMLADVDNPDHVIEVIGSKWQWAFNYINEEATDGTDVFDVGTPQDPAELWLPVDETVRFELSSPDVIHSFWVPEFYMKMDVIPGRQKHFDLTPTRVGTFTGRCAELCGLYHSRMIFTVKIVPRAEYDAHLKELKAAGEVGAPKGVARSVDIVGLKKDGE